jgi:hypothetical protein
MFIIFDDDVVHFFFHRLNLLKLLRFGNWVCLSLQMKRI